MLLAIALLSGALHLPQGDVTVRGEISSHVTTVGRPVVLTVTVRTRSVEDALITLAPLPAGLQVTSTSSSTELEISMPGGRTNISRQEYEIMATRPGSYVVLPATVRIAGRTYRTERMDLTVGGSIAPTDTESPVRLHAYASPLQPYVGQQITLKLEVVLPTDSRYRPVRPPSYDPPSPSGFWIQDLPDPITAEVRVTNGAAEEVQTFQRAYFPLSAGRFTIPPARLIYDLRGGVFFAPETRETSSDSLEVVVKPLPDAGRPPSFHGAVGSFTVSGEIDRDTVGAGDAMTYTMRVEGVGNVKSLPPPQFPQLANVEVFPPSEDAQLRVVNGVVGGVRTFQWVMIARKPGSIEIPPVEYAWFDPSTAQYATAATAPGRVVVKPSIALATAGGDTTLAPLWQGSTLPGHEAFVRTRAFLLLQVIPLALLLGVLLFRRIRNSTSSAGAARTQRKVLEARLARTHGSIGDARDFYNSAISIVRDAADAAGDALDDAQRARCGALLAELRAALYAPVPPDQAARAAHLEAVRDLVLSLTPIARRPNAGGPAAAIVLLLTLLPVSLSAQVRTDTVRSWRYGPFGDGLQAYHQGDYRTAVADLTYWVKQNPSSVAGWYDLGNAAYRANDPGRAVWAWLHALQLQPRNRETAHNLELLGARRAAASVEGWFPVSDAELAIVASACWWLAVAITLLHLRRPRPRTRIAALLFGTGVATALIMLAARWAGPDVVVPFNRGATLYAAPTTRTDAHGRLDVGDAAEIIRREGDWLLVRTSDYTEGWVRIGDVGEL